MKFSRKVENLIANLRSMPKDENRSVLKEPFKADTLMEVIQERYNLGKPKPEKVIMENWKHIMGPENAHRTCPTKIIGKRRLLVAVANATLRQELSFHRHMILNRIRRLPGCEGIKELTFTTG